MLTGPGAVRRPGPYSRRKEVYPEEFADLAAWRARCLPLDEAPLAMACDPDTRARLASEGEDPEALVEFLRRVDP